MPPLSTPAAAPNSASADVLLVQTSTSAEEQEGATTTTSTDRKKVFGIPNDFPTHPGGQATLDSARKATNQHHKDIMFLTYHMGCDLEGRITKLAKNRWGGIKLPERGDLYNEIHRTILQIKKDHPHQRWIYQAWCLFITVTFWICLLGFILTGQPAHAVVLSLCMVSYAFNIFHMRQHRGGKVYEPVWLDRLSQPLYDFMDRTYAIQPEAWRENHNESHHIVTNDPFGDYDVLSPQGIGIRIHPAHSYHWYHRFQPIYVPFMFALNSLTFPLENLVTYKGNIVYFVFYYLTLFILPTYLHGWGATRCLLQCFLIVGFVISILFQVSHNHSELQFSPDSAVISSLSSSSVDANKNPRAMTKMTIIDDWIRLQINESMSWGGYFEGLVVGGINYQLEHHIAPALPPTYYYYLSPYLKDMAKKKGWQYVYEPNFFAALWAYNQHLYRMSLPPGSGSGGDMNSSKKSKV